MSYEFIVNMFDCIFGKTILTKLNMNIVVTVFQGHIAGNDDIEPWVVDQVSAVKTEFVDTQKEKIAAL